MRNIILFLLLLTGATAFAQSDVIINRVTLCIAEGRYNDAEKFLDSLIKADPQSIDALMMKGNVLLNYALMMTPPQNTITPEDESIYSQELASLKTPIVLIPKEQAQKIEKIWKRCIAIDSARLDIREGLCTLYGMAGMKKELLDYLPVIAKAGQAKGNDFIYVLMQYAQLLAERGDKDGSYEVYKKVAALYPTRQSVWCQLATAYQAAGDLTNAKLYADKSFAMPATEIAACGGALDLYAITGEYSKALQVMKAAGQDFPEYPFYLGISKYAHHDSTWRSDITTYLKSFPTAPDSNREYTAAAYMLSPQFKNDYDDLAMLLTFSNSDFYTALIVEKAMHDYKDSVQPYLEAAKLMADGSNFIRANALYAAIENKKMDKELATVFQLEYGYSLYRAHEYTKAIVQFNKMTDPSFAPIANYFLAQCYLKQGNKNKAMGYFKLIIESNDESKYAYLAKLQVEKLSKK